MDSRIFVRRSDSRPKVERNSRSLVWAVLNRPKAPVDALSKSDIVTYTTKIPPIEGSTRFRRPQWQVTESGCTCLHSLSPFCFRGRFPITTSLLSPLISASGLPLSLGGVAKPAAGVFRCASAPGDRRIKLVPIVAPGIPIKKLCTISWSDLKILHT
jgi:hypothetical protein